MLIFFTNLPLDSPPNGIPRDFAIFCNSVNGMSGLACENLRLTRSSLFLLGNLMVRGKLRCKRGDFTLLRRGVRNFLLPLRREIGII